ncbi:hypothetical protein PMW_129 [Pseudomonas phage phiPMW]|uniref:Uncharacterized protein n=1 Tax=Pseudomonas phage phiPMW TaxID=1815582 RepID=A0A1S5R1I0_9CAUD|nr:hypothetical protein FDG97_gp221 [Pseudomonas phage phiPMW]ANA49254.1 hypothetical protein PMW_129 [Pseudomonas phage phiPMW]
MAFQNITLLKRLSDLLIGHYINNFNNEDANITPPAASAPLKLGTVVFRAKGGDKAAPWAVISAPADVDTANEFAIVLGDQWAYAQDFVPKAIAAGKFNAIVIKRGPVELKEFYIKQENATAAGASYGILLELLGDQGLVVKEDVTNLKVTI